MKELWLITCSVQANFFPSGAVDSSTPLAVVVLRLKPIDMMGSARIEFRQTTVQVRQSGITDDGMTEHLDTVDQITSQLGEQRDMAKSLANVLAKVDVFVTLVDRLSAVRLCLSMTGTGAH